MIARRAARITCQIVSVGLLCLAAACARNVPTAVPVAAKFPDLAYPSVPDDLRFAQAAATKSHEAAWGALQAGDLSNAERTFNEVLKKSPQFYPAQAGLGYVEFVKRDFNDALERFDQAVREAPAYVPALLGKGETLLRVERQGEALGVFEAALAADASLGEVRQRIDVLRLRTLQDDIASGQRAEREGNLTGARTAYQRALAASPDTGFLHRQLGEVERRLGDLDSALSHAERATTLDPSDAQAYLLQGAILMARGEDEPALAAYVRAQELDKSLPAGERITTLRERIALAKLPPQYRAIPSSPRLTRAELASLIGVRLRGVLEHAGQRTVPLTDTRNHWAQSWINDVVNRGLMEWYPNNTFQPDGGVTRADLADSVSRILNVIGTSDPTLRARWQAASPRFNDLPQVHLAYQAVARAVAADVLSPVDGEFKPSRTVSGAEAVSAVERLLTLAQKAGLTRSSPD